MDRCGGLWQDVLDARQKLSSATAGWRAVTYAGPHPRKGLVTLSRRWATLAHNVNILPHQFGMPASIKPIRKTLNAILPKS